jgi:hypothetical protein
MKQWQKTGLIICCILGMVISFVYHFRQDTDALGVIKAPVHVNIEIDKDYMRSVSIIATLNPGDTLFNVSAEETGNAIRQVILYQEIIQGDEPPFIYALYLRIPKEIAHETLNAIDGVSVFIGNKLFYFSNSDVNSLQGEEQGDYLLYRLPGLEYKKSLMGDWINWYGDLNLAVILFFSLFIHPAKFIITWCFLFCLIFLCRSDIANIYAAFRKQKGILPELLPLALVVLAGFVLRLNGYDRYSSWYDEVYSATIASNPHYPFMNTFGDPGNPPFYFILLRFWFMIFGWTEQSGRLLSVVLGSAAIVPLYILVRKFADKKTAILAAVSMAASNYLIGYSQEMRAYILMVFLASIITLVFLNYVRKREPDFINLIWYVILSVLLVNTHYYGSLLVFVNFVFFVTYSIQTKTFSWRKTVLFFSGNVIVALSLLPFFIHTALRQAMLSQDFNSWIEKPGLALTCIAILIPFLIILYVYLRKTVFVKMIAEPSRHLLDYSVFVTSLLYLTAFLISQYRSILLLRYLVILFPLMATVIAIIIINVFASGSKIAGCICAIFAFAWITGGYEAKQGGGSDIYQEAQSYIFHDVKAHPQNKSADLGLFPQAGIIYGYQPIPPYVPGDAYDTLYINPFHWNEEEMYSRLAELSINNEKVLRIHIDKSQCVFKIYP